MGALARWQTNDIVLMEGLHRRGRRKHRIGGNYFHVTSAIPVNIRFYEQVLRRRNIYAAGHRTERFDLMHSLIEKSDELNRVTVIRVHLLARYVSTAYIRLFMLFVP